MAELEEVRTKRYICAAAAAAGTVQTAAAVAAVVVCSYKKRGPNRTPP